jgi:CheY-like chemotaxis protein
MAKILLVTETKNMITLSVRDHLQKEKQEVVVTLANADAIDIVKKDVSGILIYADDKLAENKQQQALTFIKNMALMDNIPIFVFGNSDDSELVTSVIPRHLIRQVFLRPINLPEVVTTVRDYIIYHKEHVKKTILIVDDSGPMLRSVKSWLQDKYHVYLANSGTIAIKNIAINRPDLILLDYEMHVIDGRQVLEMIRSEEEFADIPVIFLTNKKDPQSVISVMSLHPEGYLLKSVEPSKIVAAVDDFFDKQKAQTL